MNTRTVSANYLRTVYCAAEMVMSCKVTRPITAGAYNQFTVSISAWRVLVWQRETTFNPVS